MTTYANKLAAGSVFPTITATTLAGDTITLGTPRADKVSDALPAWQLVIVYRGQHCPVCSSYLTELTHHIEALAEVSVDVVAISGDSKEQAENHINRNDKHHIETPNFPLAYGLRVEDMQKLGVYISEPRSEKETDHPFSEPALFVVNDKGTVQLVDYSNAPFLRPDLKTLAGGLKFIRNPENNYPIRGTYQQ